jgi:hypothetical protein
MQLSRTDTEDLFEVSFSVSENLYQSFELLLINMFPSSRDYIYLSW